MTESTRPCEICGQAIDPERLEAVPETRLCMEHARKIERFGKEFLVRGKMERTSKAGSLKHNYGGVTPVKKRNDEGMRKLREEYLREQDKTQP